MKCWNPNCSALLAPSAIVCNTCGEERPQQQTNARNDPLRWNCAFHDHSGRCSKLGRFSQSTLGTDLWFCEQHFPVFANRNHGQPVPMPAHTRAILERINPPQPQPLDFDAIAERAAIEAD